MNNDSKKVKNFTDLDAWKEGHKLVLMTYKILKKYPKSEQFGLISQMQRSAVSITSNIAEGFSRRSYNEKIQFYYTALGSTTELQNQFIVSKDIGYIDNKNYEFLRNHSVIVHKLINGLIKKSKTYVQNS